MCQKQNVEGFINRSLAMSKLYLVMNDYNENERFLKGVFDIKKTYPVKESKYDFPYYIEDENCPDNIYLNLEEDKEISFDYRKDQGHVFSSNLWELISKFRMPEKYIKNLSISCCGESVTSDKKYKYVFFPAHDFINYKESVLLDVTRGSLVPNKIIFNESSLNDYDIFQLGSKVVIGLRLVINESVKLAIEKNGFTGFKIIPLGQALAEYCKDYNFEPNGVLKRNKAKLP
ncbi:Imm43 family immunity protein [Serratia fonticola]|uniref:Imm43 family immunity protein n=1 Tax=Serratia fonticola TaxID=47917 RepID=UPI0034C62B4D